MLTVAAATGVLANDTDADGDALTPALVQYNQQRGAQLGEDGSFTYTPNSGFHGTDQFTYQASDGTLQSATATATITVNPVNQAPTAVSDAYPVDEDNVLTVAAATGVLSNDTDADGDALVATLVASPSNGSLVLNADGSLTYAPNADYYGTDTFTYTANDGLLSSAATTVTITVTPVNDPPVATADAYRVSVDGTLVADATDGVLANDTDIDNETLTATLATAPEHGTVTLNADGSLSYVPDAGFRGTDTFTYRASDGTDESAAVTVTIQVNTAPEAVDDTYTVNEDGVLAIDAVFGLLANDSNPDGDRLTAWLVAGPSHGELSLDADGSFTYTPNAEFSGTDTFSYRVDDGDLESNVGTVTVTVAEVDDPVAVALPAEFTEPSTVAQRTVGQTIDFTVAVSDPDDSAYGFQLDLESSGIPTGEALPTIDASTGRFLWTPSSTGRFQIRVIVINGDGEANQETFLIDILPV